jgi:Putative transposase/Transposase zinc-binding domain
MVELADIFHHHGPEYRAKFGDRMPPSHLRALHDIEQCRTESLGGHLYYCEPCQQPHYSYHSCKNRHCPKCQNDQAEQWLANQQSLLLPVPHFLVTFTLPDQLRTLARSHQQTMYNLLFRTSAEAVQALALDPRFIGGRVAMVGVLHTWTRDLRYHPHVHYVVAGGGLTAAGHWHASQQDFLMHVKPLSVLFRAKFRDGLKKTALFPLVDAPVWQKDWVVHCEPVGRGQAAFRYLAPYIFRVAISNRRILQLEDGKVTFQYKEAATNQRKTCTVPAEEFIRRFLQHVLPNRFIKVRYYGLLSPGNRHLLTRARQLLGGRRVDTKTSGNGGALKVPTATPRCPKCGSPLILVQTLRPQGRLPP